MTRRRYPKVTGLTPALAEYLFHGRSDIDPFLEFDNPDFAAIWREHRSALLREWRRGEHTGHPWAMRQFEGATE